MIFKGNEAVRPYKSQGNYTVYANDGVTELETLPWYTELLTRKGDGVQLSLGELIHPGFPSQTSAHRPSTNNDCCVGRFSEPYHNSIQLCADTNNSSFGFYMYGAQNSHGAGISDFSKEESLVGKIALGFDMHQGSYFNIEAFNQNQSAINVNAYDIVVDDALATTAGFNRIYAGFGGTFLTNNDVTGLELELYEGFSLQGSNLIDKSGEGSAEKWTSISPKIQALPFTQFNNVKLWYIQILSATAIPNDSFNLHVAPRLVVSNATTSYHVLATNLFYCAYLATVS